MSETVVIRQNQDFETQFLAVDPAVPEGEAPRPVTHLHSLTPYGMMLASLGSCTAIVLHTYANSHNLPLESVEIRLQYLRRFQQDCENCEAIEEYREEITEEIQLVGDLSTQERQKLLRIAHYCPIYKMYTESIPVHSQLVEM